MVNMDERSGHPSSWELSWKVHVRKTQWFTSILASLRRDCGPDTGFTMIWLGMNSILLEAPLGLIAPPQDSTLLIMPNAISQKRNQRRALCVQNLGTCNESSLILLIEVLSKVNILDLALNRSSMKAELQIFKQPAPKMAMHHRLAIEIHWWIAIVPWWKANMCPVVELCCATSSTVKSC